jgi:hypothetical protein
MAQQILCKPEWWEFVEDLAGMWNTALVGLMNGLEDWRSHDLHSSGSTVGLGMQC